MMHCVVVIIVSGCISFCIYF